jgi:type II secretory pathway component PulC
MPDAPLTPEEKLLRIIESPAQSPRPMPPRRMVQDFRFSLNIWNAKFKEKCWPRIQEALTLKTANFFLVIFSVFATIFLVFDFSMGAPRASALAALELQAKKADIGDMTFEAMEPVSVYIQEITQRNIFSLPEPPKPIPAQPVAQAAPLAVNPAQGLKVVGIIWSDYPQAIIEDSTEGKTHLLSRGSKLKNGRVKEILKDRVILSYDGQDIELR